MSCTCSTARERKACRRRDYCEAKAIDAYKEQAATQRRQAAREIVDTLSHADADTLDTLRELLREEKS